MERLNFYRRERLYTSSCGISSNFVETCPKELTFYNYKQYNKLFRELFRYWHGTIFNEVNILQFEKAFTPETKVFAEKEIKNKPIPRSAFVSIMFSYLYRALLETWDSKKFHIIPHSSGYDSRVISLLIKRYKEEYGSSYLGDFLFVECWGEHEEFKEIMKLEGWDKSQYMVLNEMSAPSEKHNHCFNFSDAWKRGNGYMGYPVNCWYSTIEWLQNKGYAPKDDNEVQCYTGYGANELTRIMNTNDSCRFKRADVFVDYTPRNVIGWYFPWVYYHNLSTFALKGDWIHPYYYFEFLERYAKYGREHVKDIINGESMSKVIVQELSPDLYKIHRGNFKEACGKGYFHVSDDILNMAVKDYESSWYYKTMHPEVNYTNRIEYNEWWGSWYVASLCEYLLKNGHTINGHAL